jgi:hypothetical protein
MVFIRIGTPADSQHEIKMKKAKGVLEFIEK